MLYLGLDMLILNISVILIVFDNFNLIILMFFKFFNLFLRY